MTTSSGRKRKIIKAAACAAALAALAAITPQARAEYGSEFTFEIGFGFSPCRATGIGAGQAVGWDDAGSGWLWLSPDNRISLGGGVYGTSGPQQVGSNNQGAALWSGTAASAVNLTPAGFSSATAIGIGGGKEVGVGVGTVTGGNQHALLWSGTAASYVDLHPAGFLNSTAVATSGTQQVGNATMNGSTDSHAMLWSGTAASAIDLTPPGFSTATATGVANGQQVGYSGGHALLWSGTAASYVELNPSGITYAQAYATNGMQQVGVGYSEDNIGVVALPLLWSGTAASAVDLSSYLPASSDEYFATSIDAYGNVAGYSQNRAYTFYHVVEWLNGNLYKIGGTGAWATSTNWASGTPQSGQDVMLLQCDATNRTISYTNANSAIILGKLTVDATGTGSMTLSQAQDSLKTTSESIGVVGKGVFTQSGGTHLVSGTLTIAERAGSTGSYTLSGGSLSAGATAINSGGILNYNGGSCSLGDVSLNGAGRIIVGAGGGKVLDATSLAIAPGAKLDLNSSSMLIDYAGSSPISTISGYIKTGYANGAWTGNGITSSAAAAAATSAHKTAMGYGEASALGITTFHGQAVDGSAVLVAYTYAGDANLDGKVDTLDFNSLAANFGGTASVWTQADFNYDGAVDTLDFNFLASNFGQQISEGGGPGDTLVPEPSMAALIMSVGAMSFPRKRRHRGSAALHPVA